MGKQTKRRAREAEAREMQLREQLRQPKISHRRLKKLRAKAPDSTWDLHIPQWIHEINADTNGPDAGIKKRIFKALVRNGHLRHLEDNNYRWRFNELTKVNPSYWVRDPETWVSKAKGARRVYEELVSHLFDKYSTKNGLYELLGNFGEHGLDFYLRAKQGQPLSGNSLTENLLSKKAMHHFLQAPTHWDFPRQVMYAVAQAHNLSPSLKRQVTQVGKFLYRWNLEKFWVDFVQWYAKQDACHHPYFSEVASYVAYCRYGMFVNASRDLQEGSCDYEWHFKGRSIQKLRAQAAEWSQVLKDLNHKGGRRKAEGPIGWEAASLETPNGQVRKAEMRELLDAEQLYHEGKRMGHCVFTYRGRMLSGEVSIYHLQFLNHRKWEHYTIEMDRKSGNVLQFLGRFNADPSELAAAVLLTWGEERQAHWIPVEEEGAE